MLTWQDNMYTCMPKHQVPRYHNDINAFDIYIYQILICANNYFINQILLKGSVIFTSRFTCILRKAFHLFSFYFVFNASILLRFMFFTTQEIRSLLNFIHILISFCRTKVPSIPHKFILKVLRCMFFTQNPNGNVKLLSLQDGIYRL